jgi:glycosyltransferase involved in cell wall biosynthesis
MDLCSEPLVSVVTPAYNEEEFLAECIESVLTQTYRNWDYTIVNNCSTDRTLEIARRYAKKDSRIRVYDGKQFLPMLANHNRAIRQISPDSKYCKVALADDWIFPECLEKMVTVAETHPTVGIVSSHQLHGQQMRATELSPNDTVIDGRELRRRFLLYNLVLFDTQNSVLYRADLVRNRDPFYLETETCCADWEACLALLRESDFGFVHQVLTFSRPRAQSIGAIAWDLGANFGSQLGFLFAYGRECLTPREFEACVDRTVSEYCTFLGRRVFVEFSRAFWSYHKQTFASLGMDFSLARIAVEALKHWGNRVLNPKSTLESVARYFALRKIRNHGMRAVVSTFETDRNQDRGRTNETTA